MDYAKIFAQNLPMEQGVIEKSDKNGNKALTSEQRKVVRRYSDALSKNYILRILRKILMELQSFCQGRS